MKNIFKEKILAIAGFIAAMTLTNNCTNLTDNLSTDPVNITDGRQVPVPQYISGVEVSVIGVYEGDVTRTVGMWSQYFSGDDRQYIGLANYATSGQDYDVEWGTIYASVFNNTKIIKEKSRAVNNNTAVALAQVIEAMCISTAADLWGDVPFKEIARYPVIQTPKFDTQASVYASALTLLDSAIHNFPKGGKLGGEDFFYGGDTSKWIKAAHTVKARIYLHTRDYTNALAEATKGISNATGNMLATHGNSDGQTFNLYYSFLTYDRSGYMSGSAYAATLLDPSHANYRGNTKTNENGRFNYIYAPFSYWGGLNSGAVYDLNVLSKEDAGVNWGIPASLDGFFSCSKSFPILTFEENALILAEANAKLGNAQPAVDALNTLRAYLRTGGQFGISTGYITDADLGGVQYDDYDLTDFNPGQIENTDNIPAAAALLREILEERYITLAAQIEGFNDERRTGNLLQIPTAPGKPNYPERALYSQVEVNTNPNVPKTSVGLFDKIPSNTTTY